jgi:UDP-3-O-[3-hydroxymyristoyl] N-acetylglucosamine deacetylase
VPVPIRLEGFALHAGTPGSVTLSRHEGPITFGRGAERAELESLRVARTDCGVTLGDERGFEVDLVEHLLAALAGLGIRRGVLAVVEGPELPILDGGARMFAEALAHLEIPKEPPDLRVLRRARLDFEDSSYEFEPWDSVEIAVETIFAHPAIGHQSAGWDGDPRSFCDDIAPARTFGFTTDASSLWGRGRALLAARARSGDEAAANTMNEAVLSIDSSSDVRSLTVGEPAKHKLLDLLGDLFFYGGPPAGRIVARRPGHTATHRIVPRAIAHGILSRR